MDEKTKRRIDGMSYEAMLARWRFAKVGDPMFQGEVGEYFKEVMMKRRAEVGHAARVAASKRLGW